MSADRPQLLSVSTDGECYETTLRNRNSFRRAHLAGSAQLSAQNSAPGDWQQFLSSDGVTVYDSVNNVVWLADANLAGQNSS
jgi:hypothetical protein